MTFRKFALGALSVFCIGIGGYAASLIAPPHSPASANPAYSAAPASFADLAENLLPTVVNISSTGKVESPQSGGPLPGMPDMPEMPGFPDGSPFEDFFNDLRRQHDNYQMIPPTSLGSGFIIDKDKGYIVTNNHVIKDAQEIRVTLHDNAIVNAAIIGKDEKTDLALLQADLKNHDVKEAKFGNSDVLRVGDWVIAIGNPFGLGGTVTAGIVSARKRDIQAGPYDDFIQTDASINRGNSGGPMFNLNGDVIGVNTAIYTPTGGSVGIGFAIPSVMAKTVLDQLVKYGKTRRGWIGVRIQTVTDEIAESLKLGRARGALVASITPTGPAEKSGLKVGDVILSFDNKSVTEMRGLPRIVADTEIGKKADLIVWRDGKEHKLSLTVAELEIAEEQGLIDEATPFTPAKPKSGEAIEELGLKLLPITPALRTQYSLGNDVTGLIVQDVSGNTDAIRKGLAEGDVIVEMNQTPVATIDDVNASIKTAKKDKKQSILLLVNRQGDVQFVAIRLQDNKKQQDDKKPSDQ